MKERILTNWTFARTVYFAIGILVIIQSAIEKELSGVLFGSYFAAMGLFAFGCASGNCFSGTGSVEPPKNTIIQEVEFEEVKTK